MSRLALVDVAPTVPVVKNRMGDSNIFPHTVSLCIRTIGGIEIEKWIELDVQSFGEFFQAVALLFVCVVVIGATEFILASCHFAPVSLILVNLYSWVGLEYTLDDAWLRWGTTSCLKCQGCAGGVSV